MDAKYNPENSGPCFNSERPQVLTDITDEQRRQAAEKLERLKSETKDALRPLTQEG